MSRKAKTSRISSRSIAGFRREVWNFYDASGRHDVSWRRTKNPYCILVSEMMLQQTQVSRVLEKHVKFLKAFPTVRVLAEASLADVLRAWNGLGYNRRGKYLHDAARIIMRDYGGAVPAAYSQLVELPGVGAYTASAVRVFAFNESDILIETNIRAAVIHAFFPQATNVHDRELLWLLEKLNKDQRPREWNWALMDYGAYIKRLCRNPARRSAHYARQSKFEGSLRQARGAILRALTSGQNINGLRNRYMGRFGKALASLERDQIIARKNKHSWVIS
ncbi:MAG: HhH-GPD family protein [Parcubacteria group bacterium GW2011_GWA2_51_10]|nr:MAG: HhH-GPD family protein [Parcubacteria group bacterium GW2011_GWA2_51_10]